MSWTPAPYNHGQTILIACNHWLRMTYLFQKSTRGFLPVCFRLKAYWKESGSKSNSWPTSSGPDSPRTIFSNWVYVQSGSLCVNFSPNRTLYIFEWSLMWFIVVNGVVCVVGTNFMVLALMIEANCAMPVSRSEVQTPLNVDEINVLFFTRYPISLRTCPPRNQTSRNDAAR